jgi:putative endonuclease
MAAYYVYILASRTYTLYVGVTRDLLYRVCQHRERLIPGFTSKYFIDRLMYFEQTENVTAAITREKQIKRMGRRKKVELIEAMNPEWRDLAEDFGLRPLG